MKKETGVFGMALGTALLVGLAGLQTGCAVLKPEGFEVGGKLGLYAVDERQSSETVTTRQKPMVCWLRNCDQAGNVVQGS